MEPEFKTQIERSGKNIFLKLPINNLLVEVKNLEGKKRSGKIRTTLYLYIYRYKRSYLFGIE